MYPGAREPVEFGSGLRSHIAREAPAPRLAAQPLGPMPAPAPVSPPAEAPPAPAAAEWVRDILRSRAGEQAERIWAVFDEALEATDADGRPDHELRIRAARALLAEIYGPPGQTDAERPIDELARLRRAKGMP